MNRDRFERLHELIKNYDVDISKGMVISKRTKKPLSPLLQNGYLRVNLWYPGTRNYMPYYVHEIIAFAGGLDVIEKTVNHIDGNKTNNAVSNLETLSLSDNIKHAFKTGLSNKSGENNHNAILTKGDVEIIREMGQKGLAAKEIAEKFGITAYHVRSIIKGQCWKRETKYRARTALSRLKG